MQFSWDTAKNILNKIKHGIEFEEVVPMLSGIDFEVEYDDEHSTIDEDRYRAYGMVRGHGEVVVVYVEVVDDVFRIISARKLEG